MELSNFFKALGDSTRLRLINILINHELNVNEIVAVMGMSQPRISRHLKILSDSGLVTFRRDGLWVFYSVNEEGESGKFIDSIKSLLISDTELNDDIGHAKTIIENREKETVKFFDSIAGDWSKLKENIIGDLDINALIARYMKKCNLAVDIGCGNGDLIPQMLKYADKVVGVDRSLRMLEQAKSLVSENADRVSLRLGEAEHLPLGDSEADLAIANMVLHHLSSPPEVISEIYRILKKQGHLIIIDFHKHNNEMMRTKHGDRWLGFDAQEIKKWLKSVKFYINNEAEFETKSGLKVIIFFAVKQ